MTITVDKSALDASIAKFNTAIAGKIDILQKSGQHVVIVEAQRLVNTLIQITPPKDKAESGRKIERDVTGRFHALGSAESGDSRFVTATGNKSGHGEIRWYAWDDQYLFGVARDADKTSASVDDLYKIYFENRVNKQGRVVGRHGRQKVLIWKKITTAADTVKKLIKRLKSHQGRLKAGWLPAWKKLGSPVRFHPPPEYVKRHASGARGYAIDGLGDKRFPQFTLENHAVGIGNPRNQMNRLVARALEIRSKAMVKRLAFLIDHPERIGEELG